jgi:cytochrome c
MLIRRLLAPIPVLLLIASCQTRPNLVSSGDPERGAAAIFRYGCGSCHTISKLRYAHGLVGPPLTNMRHRMYVAGVLPNTPTNLVRWIRDPQGIDDKTAMPNLGVTPQDATDIAAYLYTY